MLNKIEERFGKPRVLLPVVHCCEMSQARKAVDVAMNAGADGVFLIDQGGMLEASVQRFALELDRTIFVGMNLLTHGRKAIGLLPSMTSISVWADNAGFDSSWTPKRLESYYAALQRDRKDLAWTGLFFGGVAFKYQHAVPVDKLGNEAAMAIALGIDVVTTSGDATGQPPSVGKVQTIRGAISDRPLAVASGITPDNVGEFLPYVNAFLVATGIESSFGVFDEGRVRALAETIHAFDKLQSPRPRRGPGAPGWRRAGFFVWRGDYDMAHERGHSIGHMWDAKMSPSVSEAESFRSKLGSEWASATILEAWTNHTRESWEALSLNDPRPREESPL